MDENLDLPPWWRAPLRAAGILIGLLALSAVLMAGIVFVARVFGNPDASSAGTAYIPAGSGKAPEQDNARTRVPQPYGPITWPNSPGQPAGFNFKGGEGDRNPAGIPRAPAGEPERKAEVPVGISVEEYRAAADSGKKLYLPDPKGECDLSGASAAKSADALENCFARRAAR